MGELPAINNPYLLVSFFSEFYLSTLIGKPVYGLNEELYGVFRDFIVKPYKESFIVTKVRIRTKHGERVIVPWSLVRSIENDPISITLKKNIPDITTIEYDDTELRLKRDFLDQQIVDTAEHRVVRVNDVKIVAVQSELLVVAADIGVRGLLRRIGLEGTVMAIASLFKKGFPNTLLPSKYIDPLPARLRHQITLNVAQEELKSMHPADLADIVSDLDQFERLSILQTLPMEQMARTIEELEPDVRKELLERFKDDMLSKMLERLSPDSATDIVAELPARRMRQVLNAMKLGDAQEIRELLKFKEDTAGSIMNTEFIALPCKTTVARAVEELRKMKDQVSQVFYVYIVGPKDELEGVISIRDLIFAEPNTQLSSLVKDDEPLFARRKEHVDEVIEKFTKYNLIEIPVVGPKKTLVGVITVDDVLPLLQDEEN